jgi:hypothetical protein
MNSWLIEALLLSGDSTVQLKENKQYAEKLLCGSYIYTPFHNFLVVIHKMSEEKKEIREKLEHGEAVARDEGDKLVIEVPKPRELSIEEMDKKVRLSSSFCSGCTGVLTATGNFFW